MRGVSINLNRSGATVRDHAEDFRRVRAVFPDWPSELDAAKQVPSWIIRAQEFFFAGLVLDHEAQAAEQALRDGETPLSESTHLRMHVRLPALFCMAFSLELAVKAALVRQGDIDALAPGERLPFTSHGLLDLARRVRGLTLTAREEDCLRTAGDVIVSGKYPVPPVPRADRSGARVISDTSEFESDAAAIYGRLVVQMSGDA